MKIILYVPISFLKNEIREKSEPYVFVYLAKYLRDFLVLDMSIDSMRVCKATGHK